MKILLIDDDRLLTAFLKIELEEKNFEVEVAYDGNIGKNLAIEEKYDLIILDVIMPGTDGLELCKKIKSNAESPVLIITALNLLEEKVKDSGANDYLIKPFSIKELLSRIDSLILQVKIK